MQMEEGFVWIQATWHRASNAQQTHGEKTSITKILYQNVQDKYLMMTEEVPLGYVQSLTLSTML
jgi:hypothetical protein